MLSVAVGTRRRCCSPALSTASTTSGTARPLTALVHTTLAHDTCLSCAATSSLYFSSVHTRSSTLSHLLTTTTTARPSAAAISVSRKSCCVMPSDASITATTTSARRMARSARSTLITSAPSLLSATLVLFLMPAVSMSLTLWPPGSVTSVSTASRVVPLMSHTMTRSSPQMALSRLLLPTFGLPTIATARGVSSSRIASPLGSGSTCVISSSSSAVPVPVMADSVCGWTPSSQKSATAMSALEELSHLLTASSSGLSGWFCRSQSSTSLSPACTPTLPSHTKMTTSASATPAAAWRSIAAGRPAAVMDLMALARTSAGSALASLMRPPVSIMTNSLPPH
mmetsp:Transcript_27572/g.70244  ORF Transcript_27572/g.70244 Transcript_27572/m.70244 type:complete len:340 (+) Transcript_27572:685-1704(+)